MAAAALSDNQLRLMLAIRRSASASMSNTELGKVKDKFRNEIGRDPARKIMRRLEQRTPALVRLNEAQEWTLTEAGLEMLAELRPEGPTGDSPQRPYYVFEEMDLIDTVRAAVGEDWSEDRLFTAAELHAYLAGREVYVKLLTVNARNTTHALKEARPQTHPDATVTPRLVAAADRHFQVKRAPAKPGTMAVSVS